MVTIKDVAQEARVSVATVSRALSGSESVTPATRARIERAVARLRYVPHSAARSLVTGRTQMVGALLRDLSDEFFAEFIHSVDLTARAHGLHLLVSGSHGDVREAVVALRSMQGRVDGVLIMSPRLDPGFLAKQLPGAMPAVVMNSAPRGRRVAYVNTDNFGGAQAMTRHLLERGHRDLAFIEGREAAHDAMERRRGFAATIKARRGVRVRYLKGDYSEESGYRAGRALLAMRRRPDAVFAANDMMAIGCLLAFSEAGVRVPDEIALAGFDDIWFARHVRPALTTVRVQIADLGRTAMENLIGQMEAPEAPTPHATTMPCEVVERASSGPVLDTAGMRPGKTEKRN